MAILDPGVQPNSRRPASNRSRWLNASPGGGLPGERTPTRATFAALYSCALAVAPIGVMATAKPATMRRRVITARVPQPRSRPVGRQRPRWTDERERSRHACDEELADQRTVSRRARGGSAAECPGQQENGAEGSRESGPPEGWYKANLPFPRRHRTLTTPKGGRVRYYVGVDWADQAHAVWIVDESGTKVAARTVPHTAEGLNEWGRELDQWRAQASTCGQRLNA